MTPEQHELVTRSFERALEASSQDERAEILNSISDDAVRSEVEGLLSQHGAMPRTFLHEPLPFIQAHETAAAAIPTATSRAMVVPGNMVGDSKIVSLIGSGGMGHVYRARQTNPDRDVAIKVMRSTGLSGTAVRRFEHETQVLGRLSHPGIAHVYSAGTLEEHGAPIPYFVMEYVPNAQPLTDFSNREDLSLAARLNLMIDVCDAVHHGHQKGVIHRDLKPSNILVDGTGRSKVIDFGIARSTDVEAPRMTTASDIGQVLGTLQYMSPEQCDGQADVDTRCDIYSLGIILFELVVGQPRFDVTDLSLPAAIRLVSSPDTAEPRDIDPSVDRQLNAILLKAMAYMPSHRYQSASDFARDLRRYLDGDPVEASPPSAWHRLGRRVSRHPLIASATLGLAVASLSLAIGLFGLYWIGLRPQALQIDETGQSVSLISGSRNHLYTWEGGQAEGVVMAEWVRDATAGRDLAVIAFNGIYGEAPQPARLMVYDIRNPKDPVWTSTPLDSIPGPPLPRSGNTTVSTALVADLLKDVPGPEILLIRQRNPFSPECIQVYDLSGTVRYETWHWGAILGAVWLNDAERLVVSAFSSEGRSQWSDRVDDPPRHPYPMVLFALNLIDGHVVPDRFIAHTPRPMDESVAWYRWIGPVDAFATFGYTHASLVRQGPSWNPGSFVHVHMVLSPGLNEPRVASGILVVDGDGMIHDRYPDDGWERLESEGTLPSVDVLQLFPYAALPTPRQ